MTDVLVIGAGFAGSVVARELAERGNKKVTVIEKRSHVAGNCFDKYDENNILIHQYGPHIFHTNNKRAFDYLCRFTHWLKYDHKVIASLHGKFIPVPFNLNSLHQVFDEEKANRLEKKLIDTYGLETKIPILKLRESDDKEINELAEFVYENVFLYYTMKQWGKQPNEIDPNVTGRVPVFISRDDRYFQDKYQGIPLEGYTKCVECMLDHPGITLKLGIDAKTLIKVHDNYFEYEGKKFDGTIIFTGQVDELYDIKFGRLPYRTLDFKFETHDMDYYQPGSVVNYTVDEDFTRITEFKLLTMQMRPGKTTIVKEFSKEYIGENGEIPYYTCQNPESQALFDKYKSLTTQIPNFYLLGRLAEFKYYNIDGIVGRALDVADRKSVV